LHLAFSSGFGQPPGIRGPQPKRKGGGSLGLKFTLNKLG
jgi:hypothetical protein